MATTLEIGQTFTTEKSGVVGVIKAVDKAMKVLLSENEVIDLMNAIDELEKMRDEVMNNGE